MSPALGSMTVLYRCRTLVGTDSSGYGSEVMTKSLVILMLPSNVSSSTTVFARIVVVFNWTKGSSLRFQVALDSSASPSILVGLRIVDLDLLNSFRDIPNKPGRSLSTKGLRWIRDAQIKPEQYSVAIQFLVGTIYQKGSAQYIAAGVDEVSRTISDTQGLNLGQSRDLQLCRAGYQARTAGTYTNPTVKLPSNKSLRLSCMCKFQIIGMGKSIMIMSLTRLKIA